MTWETWLLELAKLSPTIIHVVSDALRGGDTPEQAIAKAKAAAPKLIDTTEGDEAARDRIRNGS